MASYALFLTMRHNMHMFQLNGYKNDEHINWIKKNLRQQWLLGLGLVLGVSRLFCQSLFLDIFIYITLYLEILVYRAMRRLHTKKPIVYTARVKRMILTIISIILISIVIIAIFADIKYIAGACVIFVSAQWVMNILANIVNHPIEISVNRYYINDAKKKLKERSDLLIIGVTGSFGKTSMKYYLQTLLQRKYNVLVTPGNFNTPLGITRTIREFLKPTHEVFICEMGARREGEIKEICELVHPKHGVITSIGPQHLETFFNMETIQKTKFELADSLPKDGMLFLNGDNEYIRDKAVKYENKILYITEGSDGYYAKDIVVSQYGTDFTVVAPNCESERFQMKLIGIHNVINVIGAIAVAHRLGMTFAELKIPVRQLQPVEHRMQMRENGVVTIIDDAYNSNPIGSKAAVETLAMFEGLRILITPGMVELGEQEVEYNYKFGTYAAECCDYILLIGEKRTQPIKEGVLSKGFPKEKCLVYDKLEDAISYAYSIYSEKHKYILLENDLPDNY